MKLTKSLRLALNMLLHSKLRSWLTVIGIVIGVTAVVSIVSIGEGLKQSVGSQLGGLGQDIITISSGSSRAFGGFRGAGEGGGGTATNIQRLSTKDTQALKLVPGIKYIDGIVSGRTDVYYLGEKTSLSVEGHDPAIFKDFVLTGLSSGRLLSQGGSREIVIGSKIAKDIFKDPLSVGYILSINDIPFRVVGILESSTGFGSSDNQIYMSVKDAREVLGTTIELKDNEFSSVRVKLLDVNFADEVVAKIEAALINTHHIRQNKKDFSVTSPTALQDRFNEITSSITLFLGAIALVSLIVGAIGVANTMFTSVLEKTKEIGIMKAIGAKNFDILLIFLFNSGMLGLVGGLLGILFGALVAYALPNLGISLGAGQESGGLKTAISFNLLLFSMFFSLLIGMIAGAIPAYRASRLKPVDALRYE